MNWRKTKIVTTIGPASNSYDAMVDLVKAGANVFRLNFSHGSHEDHDRAIANILTLREDLNVHVGILADLQGPKIRLGEVEDGGVEVREGELLTLTTKSLVGTREIVPIDYPKLPRDIKAGERVLIDDGNLVFEVHGTNGKDEIVLKTLFGGTLKSRKGVNLPDTRVSLPSISEKDRKDLDFILTRPVNWIALSFVRSPRDLKELQSIVNERDHPAKIIAKIEKPEAVKNIDKIIKNANAIMIARGDLGVEVPMEKLPAIQKGIIRKCIQRARPVIVATQMMESMIRNPSPTRAEITDVANAVMDGTDAVMLSAETSVGDHPIKVVEYMNKIVGEAEKHYSREEKRPKPSSNSGTFISDVVCFNAAKAAEEVKAKAILGMTISGYTAFKISSFRPDCSIYIFSEVKQILSTLNLVWGVRCFHYDRFTTTDETIQDCMDILKGIGLVKEGDVLVNTGSMPIYKRLRTNMLKVTVVD